MTQNADSALHSERRRIDAEGHIIESYCAYDGFDWPCPARVEPRHIGSGAPRA